MKQARLVMVWFLPIIVIGGLFFPVLGYLVFAMMAFFITLSFFRGRYWCWNLCPRGTFLDIVMPKVSPNRPSPKLFTKKWFRWLVFTIFISFFIFRITQTGGSLLAIGVVFVSMCIVTTIISIILALTMKPRSWCSMCPMGTLQEHMGKIGKKK
ncbi:MAG: 4Fe-4S binding protein [Candidatus Omnitrophica bacterium]|nr:4Fe-4S binding protein [Candidatus Omnitrophota bacterium]